MKSILTTRSYETHTRTHTRTRDPLRHVYAGIVLYPLFGGRGGGGGEKKRNKKPPKKPAKSGQVHMYHIFGFVVVAAFEVFFIFIPGFNP